MTNKILNYKIKLVINKLNSFLEYYNIDKSQKNLINQAEFFY